MKNLFQPDAVDEVISRIDKLQPTSQRQWGKMDVAQMMAHCSAALDLASGRLIRPRILIGRLIGPLSRPIYSNDKPFSRNSPTDKKLALPIRETSSTNRSNSKPGPAVSPGRRGRMHEAPASLLRQTHAARVEHGHVQAPGPSPAPIRSVMKRRAHGTTEVIPFSLTMPDSLSTLQSAIERLSTPRRSANPAEARPTFFDFRAALTAAKFAPPKKLPDAGSSTPGSSKGFCSASASAK